MKEPRRIQKDDEWLRLEAKVNEIKETLCSAQKELDLYSRNYVADQLGLVLGKTVVLSRGERYQVDSVESNTFEPWIYGRRIRKNGTPSERVSTLYRHWEIETP